MKQLTQLERDTQNRVVQLFQNTLGYKYLGNWEDRQHNSNLEEGLLRKFLQNQSYTEAFITKALQEVRKLSGDQARSLYEVNKEFYGLLRYGVKVKAEVGALYETVWLIEWNDLGNNDFYIAEEVSIKGENKKRPDIVIYVNGIALGVIELKRGTVSVNAGIRQNLDNQKANFIKNFFNTIQLVLAGNDTQGLRYGVIKTPEKYYQRWKEEQNPEYQFLRAKHIDQMVDEHTILLDQHIMQFCHKERFLEIIHDFTVFDKGVKKLCRPNQYFGIKAAQERLKAREGGIFFQTQGSGKSLSMVWLTKWVKENITDSRVLIITDREELDAQIQSLFQGVDERVRRIGYDERGIKKSYEGGGGKELIDVLNEKTESLICSLIHKFGRHTDEGDYDAYIEELVKSLPDDFEAKGDIYVWVDEAHRTQSGKLHDAMKKILPKATFIGFTGTPLLKKDKATSIEVFGGYIGNPYRFDEAVEDGVVLDLLYEARDVEQLITDQQSIDEWFDAETKGLTDVAKRELKKRWGTMQKVLGSKSRLEKIVYDIIKDFKTKPRLSNGMGNAMLVTASVYQACRYYEIFQSHGFKKCAIITSYQPHHAHIKGEETGEGNPTEALLKYEVYTKMLNGKSPEIFEMEVKKTFIKKPAKMQLLIVVDKLLTGFDAPSATYLYIDKKMQDHGLFQAICRVNRVHTADKEYGYIIDYKDLFMSLQKSINDYTSGAFDDFDEQDINGLLKDRKEMSKERLETALEALRAMCEPVHPRDEPTFIRFFCGDTEKASDLSDTEEKRVQLYKAVSTLVRAYTNVANEMGKLEYTQEQATKIKEEVQYYADLKETIKLASGDKVDFKAYEAGMRQLMDMYLDASRSKKISDFENQTLVDLIIKISEPEEEYQSKKKKEAVAETIENNVRKVIIEESSTNPQYYEKMSKLLEELIKKRKDETVAYQQYLEAIKELAKQVSQPSSSNAYPESINSRAKQALYDNLGQNEDLALELDSVIQKNKMDDWRDGGIREKKLMLTVYSVLQDEDKTLEIMEIIKAQREY